MLARGYFLFASLLATGCGDAVRSQTAGASAGALPSSTSISATAGEESAGDGDNSVETGGGTDESGTDGDDTIKLDVGAGETGGPTGCAEGEACGCTAVDILFVWDNSGSMGGHQASLAAAFPQFVDAMFEVLPAGVDLHVGLTLAHFCPDENNGGHNETALCKAAEPDSYILEAFKDPADEDLGLNGLQGRLFEHQGQRFAVGNTGDAASKASMQSWFSGLPGAIGFLGCNPEFPAAAAGFVTDPANATFNDGFVRDEGAVLLIFMLSDEGGHSDLTPGGVQRYVDQVVDAKQACGGAECVVTGGLLNERCVTAEATVWEFLSAFGSEPAWGDVGEPDFFPFGSNEEEVANYTMFMRDALAQVVATKCEEIPPPAG